MFTLIAARRAFWRSDITSRRASPSVTVSPLASLV
jgi:hypothetical protein